MLYSKLMGGLVKKYSLKFIMCVTVIVIVALGLGFGGGVYYSDHRTAKVSPGSIPTICNCPMEPAGGASPRIGPGGCACPE